MRCSRLALPQLHIPMVFGAFYCFASVRVIYSFKRQYSCNNYTLFVTFGIAVNIFVRMCGINVHGHTCNEYSGLAYNPGMTPCPIPSQCIGWRGLGPPFSWRKAPETCNLLWC
jgi:hypothetical protein